MDDQQEVKKEVILAPQEEQELRDGQALLEMTETPGFAVLKKHLETLAYHSWIDPRETKDKEEWEWRELNGFHAANAAKEILEMIETGVSKADYLYKVKKGEIQSRKGMRF